VAATFDTLRAARRLKEAAASEPVAEAIAEVLRESRELDIAQLATKTDLEQLRLATKTDLEQLRLATKTDLEQLRLATTADLAELKTEVLKWVIGLMIAQTAAIVGLVKLLLGHA
jgi:hypothetical protein